MSVDLLNKIGKKEAVTVVNKAAETKPVVVTEQHAGNAKGENLIAKTANTGTAMAEAQKADSVEPIVESQASQQNDPNSWTLENALKEIKKLREENKSVRHKYEEKVLDLEKTVESKIGQIEERYKPYTDAAKELEELRSKEADKKRDMTEKLAHREALLAETQAKLQNTESELRRKLSEQEMLLNKYQAEQEAQLETYRVSLTAELNAIPEKFRSVADLLVKGAGDPRDALVAIKEARIKGLFEDKTVIVSHSTPGARDGARISGDAVQSKVREELDKLSPSQKISLALTQMRKGEPNNAFTADLKK